MPLYGPKWPLKRGNEDIYELYTDAKSQVSFYLKNLLLTHPGENISDPRYGVGLRTYLFEPNIEGTRSVIESRISEQIVLYLPYLSLKSVTVDATAAEIDQNELHIKIVYAIPDVMENTIFDFDLSRENEIGFY